MVGPGTLVVERDGEPILEVRLERGRTVLGSHPTSDVVLPGERLPAVAMVVLDTGERFRVRRLDPTLDLPGSEDDEADVEPGTPISLGGHVIRLERRGSPRRPADRTRVLDPDAPGPPAPALQLWCAQDVLRVPSSRPFAIGSDPSNDLVLATDPFVSSFHCRLVPGKGRWSLVDLDSTNGTTLGGLRVREAELPADAELTVGRTQLRVRRAPELAEAVPTFGMLGESRAMQHLRDAIPRLAESSEPVLVTGESGTGKELVARALHEASGREGPFLALNCGALSESLVESELFGHVKGAFTGAASDRKGAFEATRGGTLFLDEIGELPRALQPKLLRALETSSIRPVGGTAEISVDVRIVAATHRNLDELVSRREFREDLFHRLFVLAVQIPALRDRSEDIVPLARHFLAQQPGSPRLSEAAEAALRRHPWPGNVRELRNAMIRALYAAAPSNRIELEHLRFSALPPGAPIDVRRRADREEKQMRAQMVEALQRTGGNRSEAARVLGVSKSTFFDRLKRFGIE